MINFVESLISFLSQLSFLRKFRPKSFQIHFGPLIASYFPLPPPTYHIYLYSFKFNQHGCMSQLHFPLFSLFLLLSLSPCHLSGPLLIVLNILFIIVFGSFFFYSLSSSLITHHSQLLCSVFLILLLTFSLRTP